MNITEISNNASQSYNPVVFKPQELKPKADKNTQPVQKENNVSNWQTNILLDALDLLENSKQSYNNHPLARLENNPIETSAEAQKELAFFTSDKFKSEASGAQANISAKDVLSLFTEN